MSETPLPLPSFLAPPVTEVALSVQFDRIGRLRTPQMGLLWLKFREHGFHRFEEHPPIEPVIEVFEVPPTRRTELKFEFLPALPRLWFLKDGGTELIQIQQDRFVHNWRKSGSDDKYPRYENIRETFRNELKTFVEFVQEEKLESFTPIQCEVTYVNHIIIENSPEDKHDIEIISTVFDLKYSDSFLPLPEEVRFSATYRIPDAEGNPLGRLHINFEPRFRRQDGKQIFEMNLIARGKPEGSEIDDIVNFLDLGREWIVRGFTSITTSEMHKNWERER